MSDIIRINYPIVKANFSNLISEKDNFTSSTYATFLIGYISESGDDTVAKMAVGLRGIYKDIKKSYEQIESWWNSYLENIDGIENTLSNDGRSGNISESMIRNFIISTMGELPEYKANFKTLQFEYKGTIDFMQQAIVETVADNIGVTSVVNEEIKKVGSTIEKEISTTWCSVESWWNNTATPVLASIALECIEIRNKVDATVTNFVFSFAEGLLGFGESLYDFVALISSAVGTVFTGLWDIGTAIFTDAKLGDWSATNALWNNTKSFVATEYVSGWFDDMYETTMYGQYIKENSVAFETVRDVGSGIGYMAGVVLLTIGTFGVGGAVAGGGAATAATPTVAGLTSSQMMTGLAFAAGTGRGTEAAWVDGAGISEGLITGIATGLWEGLQFFVGAKIGNSKVFLPETGSATLSQKILNSLFKIGADGIDGGIEGFVQPAIKLIYEDGYTDENGNYVEFSNDSSNQLINLCNNYCELFDDNGGWMSVATNAVVGSGSSLLGEIFDIGKFFNNNKTTSTVTPEIQPQRIIDSEHGFQLNMDDFDDFFKAKLEQGFFTREQLEQMINKINSRGYIDNNTGQILADLINSDNNVFLKTVISDDVDSIFEKGIYCLGTSTSGANMMSTMSNRIDLEHTVTETKSLYELITRIKGATGISQGGNPIDGAVIISVPKDVDINDIYIWNNENNVFCIDPKYIVGFCKNQGEGVIDSIRFNENFESLEKYIKQEDLINSTINDNVAFENPNNILNDVLKRLKDKTINNNIFFGSLFDESNNYKLYDFFENSGRSATSTYGVDQGAIETLCKYYYNGFEYDYHQAMKIVNDYKNSGLAIPNFDKLGLPEYHDLKNKLILKGFTGNEASIVLSSINDVGACSYACAINNIFYKFQGNEVFFENIFGYSMYKNVDGNRVLNSTELLLDLYLFANDCDNGGCFIKDNHLNLDLLGDKIDVYGRTILDTKYQKYMSDTKFEDGFNSDLLDNFLKSKNSDLKFDAKKIVSSLNQQKISDEEFNKIIEKLYCEISNGKAPAIHYFYNKNLNDVIINMYSYEPNYYPSMTTEIWNEGGGHATAITGITDNGLIISSWGKKYMIPFDDLKNGARFEIFVSDILFRK